MSYFLGRVYMGGLLTSDAPDPITPADGIQNFIGDLDIAGTLYMGGNKVDLSIAKDGGEFIWSNADSSVEIGAAAGGTAKFTNTQITLSKFTFVVVSGIGETTAAADNGLIVGSLTDSTDGVQEYSPLSVLYANGWDDTAAQTSVPVQYAWQVQPVQVGGALCTSNLALYSNIDSAGFSALWTFKSDGTFGNVSGAAAKIDLSIDGGGDEAVTSDLDGYIRIQTGGSNTLTVGPTSSFLTSLILVQGAVAGDDKSVAFGTDSDSTLAYEVANNTVDTMVWGLPATSNHAIICEVGDVATDWNLAQQTNPTLVIQSADATTITDRLMLAHNQTDAVITSGAGAINLVPATSILNVSGGVKATAGYCIEGASSSRQVMRMATLRITGVTDNTQVTLEMFDAWNSEAIATETVTEGSGGTRFENNAAGNEITIKALSQEALVSTGHHIHSNDNGTDWNLHVAESSGDLTVTATNPTTGAAIVFSDIGNGKIIDVNFGYLTST